MDKATPSSNNGKSQTVNREVAAEWASLVGYLLLKTQGALQDLIEALSVDGSNGYLLEATVATVRAKATLARMHSLDIPEFLNQVHFDVESVLKQTVEQLDDSVTAIQEDNGKGFAKSLKHLEVSKAELGNYVSSLQKIAQN